MTDDSNTTENRPRSTDTGTDSGQRRHGRRDQLVDVSDLNEFLYCPRRYWYRSLFAIEGRSEPFDEGTRQHDRQARRQGGQREQYFRSDALNLHGRVDFVETPGSKYLPEPDRPPAPVERKHSTNYFWNDEIQLAGYCLLVEQATGRDITSGYIYLYETDTRHRVEITAEHRSAVTDTIQQIRALDPTTPPPFVDNPNKCDGCAVRHVCLPATTSRLEPSQAVGSGWEATTQAGTQRTSDPDLDRGEQS